MLVDRDWTSSINKLVIYGLPPGVTMCKCNKIELGMFVDNTGKSQTFPKIQNLNAYGTLEKDGMCVIGNWFSTVYVICRFCKKCYVGKQHFDQTLREVTRVEWSVTDSVELERALRAGLSFSERECARMENELASTKKMNAEKKALLNSLFGER